jgi:hypothetical protein
VVEQIGTKMVDKQTTNNSLAKHNTTQTWEEFTTLSKYNTYYVIHDGNYIKIAKILKIPKWGYKKLPIFPSYNKVHNFVGS